MDYNNKKKTIHIYKYICVYVTCKSSGFIMITLKDEPIQNLNGSGP